MVTDRDLKPENVPHDPLSVPCRVCSAKVGERCSTITSPIRFLDEPHFTRRPRPERDLCRFCGDDLGREVARGSHYNCRLALVHAASRARTRTTSTSSGTSI